MNKILPINVGMLYFLFTIHAVKMELPYGINKSLLRLLVQRLKINVTDSYK
jgi:hypothetical protein